MLVRILIWVSAVVIEAFFAGNYRSVQNFRKSTITIYQFCHVILASKVIFFIFDLILYIPSTIFQLYRDRSLWVEPVLK